MEQPSGHSAEQLAHAALDGLPPAVVAVLVPRQDADPGLDVVVQLELDVVRLGDLGGGSRRTNLGQVVGARARDDLVPYDSLVGRIIAVVLTAGRPLGRDVDKDLLGVPVEQRAEVGVEAELDDGVLLLGGAVVIGPARDDLRVDGLDGAAGRPLAEEVGACYQEGDDEGDGGEEAEDGLRPDYGGVHLGVVVGSVGAREGERLLSGGGKLVGFSLLVTLLMG
ncbi:hypothetical protein VP1G_10882 [Cytospora mali]|uniref:Uncharacterized protein n=1 Tax=Cytospora mali TaxID=578113 RepID=A0A194UYI3_CYTMA|nr:hypothetical protein VP1G_10882 [Valsa mali var. pyri (nom. inval.)]